MAVGGDYFYLWRMIVVLYKTITKLMLADTAPSVAYN